MTNGKTTGENALVVGVKEGDRVRISEREPDADDVKSGKFYSHFRGLTGVVQKVYGAEDIAVEIEPAHLPEAVMQRHQEVQSQMRGRWLDGLSEEARGRLTEQEREFRLRYTILVHGKDVTVLP